MIRLQDCSFFIPLEQGLKHCKLDAECFQIRSFFIPLEQGLKQVIINILIRSIFSSFFIPLEQGLKRHEGKLAGEAVCVLSSFH